MSILDTLDLIRTLARSHLTLLIVITLFAIILACAVTFNENLRRWFNTLSQSAKAFWSIFTTLLALAVFFVGIPAATDPIYDPVVSNNTAQNLFCEVSSSQKITSLSCEYTDNQKTQIAVHIT